MFILYDMNLLNKGSNSVLSLWKLKKFLVKTDEISTNSYKISARNAPREAIKYRSLN